MPRPVFADPRNVFVFARIFGSEQRKGITMAFLDAMLDLDPPRGIIDTNFLLREQRPKLDVLELSIVDVECTDARDVTYVAKMQVLEVEGFDRRLVCNVDEAYVIHTAPVALHPNRHDVVGITICDFLIWPDLGERKIPMLSRWSMIQPHTDTNGHGRTRLVFLELPKLDTTRPPKTMIEKWAYFFREAGDLTRVPEVLAEPPFIDALEAARIDTFTVAEWDAYILAGIAIQNQRGALAVASKRGYERGLRKGRQQAVERLCRELHIELTDDRQRELSALDTAGMQALLVRLEAHARWD